MHENMDEDLTVLLGVRHQFNSIVEGDSKADESMKKEFKGFAAHVNMYFNK
jgi:hypothetical protein